MEYKIFDVELKYRGKHMVFECDDVKIPEEKKENYVNDNYANREPYGGYTGDDEHAFFHAQRMVRIVRGKSGFSLTSLCKRKLVQDVKNYLDCFGDWELGTEEQVRALIKYMVLLKMEEELYEIIMDYHREYEREQKCSDTECRAPLNFHPLYVSIGDKALFQQEDEDLAMMFYELAALSWSQDDMGPDEEEEDWYDNYSIYQLIYLEDTGYEEEYFESAEEEQYWGLYLRLADILSEGGDEKAVLEYSDAFFSLYERLMEAETNACDYHLMRMVLLMAHNIFNRCYLTAMYCLSGESEKRKEQYASRVIAGLKKAYHPSLITVKEYARAASDGSGLQLKNLLCLTAVEVSVNKVQRLLLVEDDDEGQEIAYYTRLQTFCYMLPSHEGGQKNEDCGKMSIMNIAYMNDPNEGKILQRYLGITERAETADGRVAERKNASYPYVFMKCFTSLVDDLPMWEMYGDHAKGCCVILDKTCFSTGNQYEAVIPLYRILYLRKKGTALSIVKGDNPYIKNMDGMKRLLHAMKREVKAAETDALLSHWIKKSLEKILYLFKDADYRHEQEVRILYRLDGPDSVIRHTPGEYPLLYLQPDFTVAIREFITGPRFEKLSECMPYLEEQIELMCRITGHKMPKITRSSIEYR